MICRCRIHKHDSRFWSFCTRDLNETARKGLRLTWQSTKAVCYGRRIAESFAIKDWLVCHSGLFSLAWLHTEILFPLDWSVSSAKLIVWNWVPGKLNLVTGWLHPMCKVIATDERCCRRNFTNQLSSPKDVTNYKDSFVNCHYFPRPAMINCTRSCLSHQQLQFWYEMMKQWNIFQLLRKCSTQKRTRTKDEIINMTKKIQYWNWGNNECC